MSHTVIINSSNALSNKNTFSYRFTNGNYNIKEGSTIAISNITIPYSWFNVTTTNNNKKLTFTWTNGGTTTNYNQTLSDGFYTVEDLNAYYQQKAIENGHYLINASGNYVYYMNFSYNVSAYAVQVLFFPVPTTLPTGWTAPANFAGYPSISKCPSLILSSGDSIGPIIGFSAGTYGGGAIASSSISNLTPLATNVNSIVVRCSLVNNGVTSPSDIIDSFPITSSFGSNINYVPNFEKWINLNPGSYSNFQISFYDQNLNPLEMRDTNILLTLLIKQ